MNKCLDKFCADCGHHLYETFHGFERVYWCNECGLLVDAEDIKTFAEVEVLRARYDSQSDIDA